MPAFTSSSKVVVDTPRYAAACSRLRKRGQKGRAAMSSRRATMLLPILRVRVVPVSSSGNGQEK